MCLGASRSLVAWQNKTLKSPPQGSRRELSDQVPFVGYASSIQKLCLGPPPSPFLPYRAIKSLHNPQHVFPDALKGSPSPLSRLPFIPTPGIHSLIFITAPCPIIHSSTRLRRLSIPPLADYYRNYDNHNH